MRETEGVFVFVCVFVCLFVCVFVCVCVCLCAANTAVRTSSSSVTMMICPESACFTRAPMGKSNSPVPPASYQIRSP